MDTGPSNEDIVVTPALELEGRMQKVSLLISVAALTLMFVGFAIALVTRHGVKIPGVAALPFRHLFSLHAAADGFTEMSVGIILLAALPMARILLAMWLYIKSRSLIDTVVAIVVLLELIFSAHI